jgi:hypothetical protein
LEFAGYKTQVFEFIGGEHTTKNVMITAVKIRRRRASKDVIKEEILSLAGTYGIRYQKLANWMGVNLTGDEDEHGSDQLSPASITRKKGNYLTRYRMPPRGVG